MEIQCKHCKYVYDYKVYGEKCPNCHLENIPFRSESARILMGFETDSIRERYFNHRHTERQEAFLRSGDPLYGKSPLRRIRPYIMMIVLAFAIALLARGIYQINDTQNVPEDLVEKPPVSELSSASFEKSFYPSGGVTFRVLHTGVIPAELLGNAQRETVQCVFIDMRGTVKAGVKEKPIGKLYVRVGDELFSPQWPKKDGADLTNYTEFDMEELWTYGTAAGQLFFYLPPDTKEFSFCWQPTSGEQTIPLYV